MKGEKLVADYKGKAKDIAGYAAAMKVSVDTTTVTFGPPMVQGFAPFQAALNANVAVAKQGQLVGPIALDDAVIVFNVTKIDKTARPFDYTNDAMAYNQREGAAILQRSLPAILLGNKKVDNRIQKFYSADAR